MGVLLLEDRETIIAEVNFAHALRFHRFEEEQGISQGQQVCLLLLAFCTVNESPQLFLIAELMQA
jgi:hypothetical protein